MSRICVKGVGKNTNEKQLRELFSSKGEVTDVKVITSKDGKSRKFAFVGFRTELQATEAQKHFNNTFIGMSKISVEMAKKFNDQSLKDLKQKFAEKKTKQSKNKDASDDESEEPVRKETVEKGKGDSLVGVDTTSVAGRKKAEFLEMMKSRKNTNKWANDDVAGSTAPEVAQEAIPVSRSRVNNNDNSESEDSQDSDSDSDNSVNDIVKGGPPPGSRPLSDLDYLRSKMKRQRSDSDSSSSSGSDSEGEEPATRGTGQAAEEESDEELGSEGDDEEDSDRKATKNTTKNASSEDASAHPEIDLEDGEEDTGRLFVKNLPFSCTEEEFSSLFATFGPISEIHLPLDEEKRGKGYGFVQYMLPEHADAAQQALASEAFQGRVLFVVKAQKPKEKDTTASIAAAARGNKAKLSSFQLKKEEERRKFLNRKEGWNAAFVRSDAVVDSLAEK